jgi:hypothetical protein
MSSHSMWRNAIWRDSMWRAVLEEIAVLAALSLFVAMISIWALAIIESW